jgi:hypothetical protein
MTRTQRTAGSKRTIGIVLIALGWLFVPASRALACDHPTFVSFASTEFGERSASESTTKPTVLLVHKQNRPVTSPHDPFDPLGPCQGPQCDTRPARPDRPLTGPSPTKVRDTWNLAYTESAADERTPGSRAWLDFEVSAPRQFSDSIFHPPRDRR